MDITVVGTGYVGLVGGACLAELGHNVICVDKDPDKIAVLEGGGLPIYEPGLDALVPRQVTEGRLTFTTDAGEAIAAADVVYIAVGTPPGADGSANLAYVDAVAASIGDSLRGYTVVVVKSTVPVGTCERVRRLVAERTGEPFDVVSNPEFLREGVAVPDFLEPDRIVVGSSSPRALEVMGEVYAPLTEKGVPLLAMDIASSELTKYASNAMLATRLSFVNELSVLCDAVGADMEHVRRGMGSDGRIGPSFLRAGVGYGGSCFPKDVKALHQAAAGHGVPLRVLAAVEDANEAQKARMVSMITETLGGDLGGRRIAVWGLAFKPDTDDVREAPALVIVEGLLEAGATVAVYDPVAMDNARQTLGDRVDYGADPYGCLEGAQGLVLVTEWQELTSPDWPRVAALLHGRHVFDGRNAWEPSRVREAGLDYRGVGRR